MALKTFDKLEISILFDEYFKPQDIGVPQK
jgi:hypothetical protein